jgi:hypothetical protein
MNTIVFDIFLFIMYIVGFILNIVITLDILVYAYDGKCSNLLFKRYDNNFKTFLTYFLDIMMLVILVMLSLIGTVFLLNIIWNIEDDINN